MERERFQQIAKLFEAARAMPVAERESFLNAACDGDADMHCEVLTLLQHHEQQGAAASLDHPPTPGFTLSALSDMDQGARATKGQGKSMPRAPDRTISLPEVIGRYRIIRELAEGGMGVVYLAEQDQPRREVALKVIKPGMDSRAVLARFELERQALAVLDHPCVAKVLDAGTTDRSLPYFVMEYVRGVPITEFCDQHRLNIDQRIRLFICVCEAVQHAHAKGVIHRDLKPSNILVAQEAASGSRQSASGKDGGPQSECRMPNAECRVKVIDFGVAKALNNRLTERTIFTEQGQLIGTPEYMSPEQAELSHLDIDTRADVYSLGVVLYELLAGALPFDSGALRSATFAEIQRIINDVDPPRPSVKFASLLQEPRDVDPGVIARDRAMESRILPRRLHGDLDWIVMKCLEKDRERRYDTADALAMDLKRHLNNEPVLAGPPSTGYRLRKFVRRNRVPVAAGCLVAAALVIAMIVSVTYALAEAKQRRIADFARHEAKQRAAELEQVVEFQQAQLMDIDVSLMGARMRHDLLARARDHLTVRVSDSNEHENMLSAFEQVISGLNFTDAALKVLDQNIFARAHAAIDGQFADQPLVKARLLRALGITMQQVGLLDRSLPALDAALEIRQQELGDDHPDTLVSITDIGHLHYLRGRFADGEPYFREALERRQRVLGEDHPDTLRSLNTMSDLLIAQGNFAEADAYVQAAHEATRRVLGDDNRETHHAINNMGLLLTQLGRLDEAEPYYREVLGHRQRELGEEHPHTLHSLNNLAYLLQQQGNYDEAVHYFEMALEGRRRVLGDEHPRTLNSMNNLAGLLMRQGDFAEAEVLYRQSLEFNRRVLGAEHPQTLVAINNLGSILRELGELDEAERCGRQAVQSAREALGPDHWYLAVFLHQHGRTLMAMQRYEDAESAMLEAHAIFVSALGAAHERTISAAQHLADLYDAWREAETQGGYEAKAAEWRRLLP